MVKLHTSNPDPLRMSTEKNDNFIVKAIRFHSLISGLMKSCHVVVFLNMLFYDIHFFSHFKNKVVRKRTKKYVNISDGKVQPQQFSVTLICL